MDGVVLSEDQQAHKEPGAAKEGDNGLPAIVEWKLPTDNELDSCSCGGGGGCN